MLAADADFQILVCAAAALGAEADQLADALLIDRLERIFRQNLLVDVLGKERAGIVARVAERHLRQIVGAEGEELRDLAARLSSLHDTLASTDPFDVTTSEAALRKLAESQGVSAAKLIHPLRLALTGKGVSPPIFDVAVVLGKDRSLRRLDRLIARLPKLN